MPAHPGLTQDRSAAGGPSLAAVEPEAWLHELDVRRATSVLPVPGGAAVLHDAFPQAHDHNKLSLLEDVPAEVVHGAAEDVLGGAGLTHRLVELRHRGSADGLLALGYTRSDVLLMTYAGGGVLREAPDVVELDLDERATVATASWEQEQPEWDAEVWRQLGQRIRTAARAAACTFLAVRDEQGRVIARTDLYVHSGVAQVEEVLTDPAHRGRGHASALVHEAVRRAAGNAVFIVADVDDWPRRMYERLGFRDLTALATYRR